MSLDAPVQTPLDGSRFSLGVVAARFNGELVDGLLRELKATLAHQGVPLDQIEVVRVPGSHEIPVAVQLLADTGKFDGIVALGVLIGGDTQHHAMVGTSVSHALQALEMVNSAFALDRSRIMGRSPANFRRRAFVSPDLAFETANHTVPTGFSAEPPPGPATPVTETAISAPRRRRAPSAIAQAHASLTAPFVSRISGDTPRSCCLIRLS